ncbi:MAG: tryptophan--tRNA ligase [Clostridiaceae bacterium]|nr:tryptophan--tRNA ligase [Clostridiaceae bacterium]
MSELILTEEVKKDRKKISLSFIQPSGNITLGNYLGALKNMAAMQDSGEFNCLYAMADLHALTVRQDPASLRKQIYQGLATMLACGIDPERSIVFLQSHVYQHAVLGWILDCYTMFGELSRMTQFKDKSSKYADNINAGLFTYPALMAADILLYQTDYVPVGQDQKQHLEIARDIANRFNGIYGRTFNVPEPYITKSGAKIMSLVEPSKKMSKSDPNKNAIITVLDTDEEIIKKFKRAVTDSGSQVKMEDGKDGINNLINIYSVVTGKTPDEIELEFEGKGYGDFKLACGEVVASAVRPIREKINYYIDNKDYLDAVDKAGAEKASVFAQRTLDKVYKKVGLVLEKSN